MRCEITKRAWLEVGIRNGWMQRAGVRSRNPPKSSQAKEYAGNLDSGDLDNVVRGHGESEDYTLWGKVDMPGCGLIRGVDTSTELLHESNTEALARELSGYEDCWIDDGDVYVKVYDDEAHKEADEPTEAFNRVMDIRDSLENYPVLDDDDFSEKETEAQLECIRDEGKSIVADWAEEGWEYEVHRWLGDQGYDFPECWVGKEKISQAMASMNILDPDEYEDDICDDSLLQQVEDLASEAASKERVLFQMHYQNPELAERYAPQVLQAIDETNAIRSAILMSQSAPSVPPPPHPELWDPKPKTKEAPQEPEANQFQEALRVVSNYLQSTRASRLQKLLESLRKRTADQRIQDQEETEEAISAGVKSRESSDYADVADTVRQDFMQDLPNIYQGALDRIKKTASSGNAFVEDKIAELSAAQDHLASDIKKHQKVGMSDAMVAEAYAMIEDLEALKVSLSLYGKPNHDITDPTPDLFGTMSHQREMFPDLPQTRRGEVFRRRLKAYEDYFKAHQSKRDADQIRRTMEAVVGKAVKKVEEAFREDLWDISPGIEVFQSSVVFGLPLKG